MTKFYDWVTEEHITTVELATPPSKGDLVTIGEIMYRVTMREFVIADPPIVKVWLEKRLILFST